MTDPSKSDETGEFYTRSSWSASEICLYEVFDEKDVYKLEPSLGPSNTEVKTKSSSTYEGV